MPYLKWGAGGLQAYTEDQATEARTRLTNLAADQAEYKMQQQSAAAAQEAEAGQMLSRIMRGDSVKTSTGVSDNPNQNPESMPDAFFQTAQQLFRAGATQTGLEYYKQGAKMLKDKNASDKDAATARQTQLENRLKQSDMVYRELGTAQTEEDFNQGLQNLQDSGLFTAQELRHLSKIPFHSEAQRVLRDRAISAKEQAKNDLTSLQQDETARHNKMTEQLSADRNAVARATLQERKWANRNKIKVGAKSNAPTGSQIRAAKTAIRSQILQGVDINSVDPDLIDSGAENIANRANDLVRSNRGMSWQTALNRSVLESKVDGDWDVVRHDWNPFKGTETSYQGAGKTKGNPITLRDDSDMSNLKKGRWYMSPTGKIGYWDGNKFTVPQ